MSNKELREKIDMVIATVDMPQEVKVLLLELKDEIPSAKTKAEKIDIGLKIIEIISPYIFMAVNNIS